MKAMLEIDAKNLIALPLHNLNLPRRGAPPECWCGKCPKCLARNRKRVERDNSRRKS